MDLVKLGIPAAFVASRVRATWRDVRFGLENELLDASADFDYPAEVAPFVRYMPSAEPDLGTREANEQRLFDAWPRYLDEASVRYARSAV